MSQLTEGFSKGISTNNWFLPVLFLIFLTLKLTNFIAWSWWWVTAPIWGPIAFALVLLLITMPWKLLRGAK